MDTAVALAIVLVALVYLGRRLQRVLGAGAGGCGCGARAGTCPAAREMGREMDAAAKAALGSGGPRRAI